MTTAFLLAMLAGTGQDSLHITFIGNAAFLLTDGTTSLVTDFPYQSGAFGYMTYDPEEIAPPGHVASVITHRHDDHFDPGLFRQAGWDIVGPDEVTQNLSAGAVIPLSATVTVGDFVIQPLRTDHSGTEHYSYLITWHGRRFYFTGDTEDPTSLLGMDQLDVAFVTPWLLCSAVAGGTALPADRVVLHHQQTGARPTTCADHTALRQGEGFPVVAAAAGQEAP